MLEGVPRLGEARTGRAFPVSVQWATGSRCPAIGDALLARDILSSQGLAAGLSSALYALACRSARDRAEVALRARAERFQHLKALKGLIDSCRYRDSAPWAHYRQFVAEESSSAFAISDVALSRGTLAKGSLTRRLQPALRRTQDAVGTRT